RDPLRGEVSPVASPEEPPCLLPPRAKVKAVAFGVGGGRGGRAYLPFAAGRGSGIIFQPPPILTNSTGSLLSPPPPKSTPPPPAEIDHHRPGGLLTSDL